MILGRILGHKRGEVEGGWKILNNEELRNLLCFIKYYKGNQINQDELREACGKHGKDMNYMENFGWKI
jgi:hypothetical protein